jgi:ABC-type Mn2+/Zn2+ transport system ATPase subunit
MITSAAPHAMPTSMSTAAAPMSPSAASVASVASVSDGTPARPVVSVEQVTLSYGRRVVLRDVSVEIRQGEFWCLLGPNGEGKTTLIKALLGAVRPSRGRVVLRADFKDRRRLGFVPQEAELNPAAPTTVEEFIRGGLVGLQIPGGTEERRIRTVLDLMGITGLRRRSLWALSGGQRQRTLVARALVRDPLLLVVDEPTAGLDLAAATGLLEIVTDLSRSKGITVVFVTHDLTIAAQRASHVAFFKGGRVTAGPTAEVFHAENLRRTYGVSVELGRDEFGALTVHAGSTPRLQPTA